MADLKFVFSNIGSPEVKKSLSIQRRESVLKETSILKNQGKSLNEKEPPQFYFHKIRATKYEYF